MLILYIGFKCKNFKFNNPSKTRYIWFKFIAKK